MPAASGALWGDLQVRQDGRLDGWCWSPDRPQERLQVDLLVDDHVAVSVFAVRLRPDLLARGCGDGRHGFAVHLPPNLPQLRRECLVTARERQSGRVFGRVLRAAIGAMPPDPRAQRVATAVAALSDEVATLRAWAASPTPAGRLRTAFGALAAQLAPQSRRLPLAAERLVPAWLHLPEVTAPVISLVLPATGAAGSVDRIAALAPALAEARAELLLLDAGDDPRVALLPVALRHLRLLSNGAAGGVSGAMALAVAAARGQWVVLLGESPALPSAAALLALARALSVSGPDLLLGAAAAAVAGGIAARSGGATLCLPARLGVVVGGRRDLCRALGPPAPRDPILAAADIALRARLLGRAWHIIQEPAARGGAVPATAPDDAGARLRARWGAPA